MKNGQPKTSDDASGCEDLLKNWCIALTGGVATGKSTVAEMLRNRGFEVFDADSIARLAVPPGSPTMTQIIDAFGSAILAPDGTLNRQTLRDIIFNNPRAKATLESIMHPAIRAKLLNEVQRKGLADQPQIFFYEAALIHETGSAEAFKEVWATVCPIDTQIQRLTKNRFLPTETAMKIINSQMPVNQKGALSDRVIDTSGSLASVEAQLDELLTKIN